jgi:hypothetical protein
VRIVAGEHRVLVAQVAGNQLEYALLHAACILRGVHNGRQFVGGEELAAHELKLLAQHGVFFLEASGATGR